jgi:hypothetical protein
MVNSYADVHFENRLDYSSPVKALKPFIRKTKIVSPDPRVFVVPEIQFNSTGPYLGARGTLGLYT